MKNGELIGEMIAWEEGSPKRINHFLKVYGLAKAIASREQLSSTTMNIVETAAILHDIGIKPCLEKYGSCQGPQQEEEGEKACRASGPLSACCLRHGFMCAGRTRRTRSWRRKIEKFASAPLLLRVYAWWCSAC